ncbi:hypothetical protein [Fluviicola sp.]|uniref:hypothetical protein n=1 Tax=Fluviicola sp. TaxID=1917219 RepID=UPI0031DA4D93
MDFSVETEKAIRLKDRKIAGIVAFTAFGLLLALLYFIGYHISNPPLSKPAAYKEMAFIPLDPQILEQVRQGSQSGTPAKASKTEITPLQTERILTAANSSAHVTSGNSTITNTNVPNNNPSSAKHVSDNPFGTGGINDGTHRDYRTNGIWDTQNEDSKPAEKVKRYLITQPNTNSIQSDENCKIVLSVLVDPDGNVVGSPVFTKGNSTTNDMVLINQVIYVVKSQAQFNKIKGTRNTKEVIAIRITAN